MPREIKFRIWDNGRMIYPNPDMHICFYDSSRIPWGLYDSKMGNRIVTGDPNAILNMPGKLMQFTGLKDKNGKDIYEGDILKFMDRVTCYVVWKEIGGWSYFWTDPAYIRQRQQNPEPFFHNISLNEVVGNIYENPEL